MTVRGLECGKGVLSGESEYPLSACIICRDIFTFVVLLMSILQRYQQEYGGAANETDKQTDRRDRSENITALPDISRISQHSQECKDPSRQYF